MTRPTSCFGTRAACTRARGNGATYLRPATASEPARFEPVSGVARQCWWFEEMPDPAAKAATALMMACADGLFEVRDATAIPVRAPRDGTYSSSTLLQSRVDPSRLWVGLSDGLASFRRVDGRWIDEDRVPGITGEIRTLAETPDGTLWAGDRSGGVIRVTFRSRPADGAPRPESDTREYGPAEGLVAGGSYVTPAGASFLVTSGVKTLHVSSYDASSDRFIKDEALSALSYDPYQPGFIFLAQPDGSVLAALGMGVQFGEINQPASLGDRCRPLRPPGPDRSERRLDR